MAERASRIPFHVQEEIHNYKHTEHIGAVYIRGKV